MRVKGKRKLSILILSSDKFPPFRVDVAVLFGRKIRQRGHIINWVLQSEKILHKSYEVEWSGCNVLVGPTDNGTLVLSKIRKNFYSIFHDLRTLIRVRKKSYDIIIVKDKFISGLISLVAAKLSKTKLIYWLSFPFPELYLYELNNGVGANRLVYWLKGHFFKYSLYKILLPNSEHIFVQTVEMLGNIANQGIAKDKMTPVPMGVSIEDIPFWGYEREEDCEGDEKIVLYLGTLSRVRRIDFLLRVFEKVLRKQGNAKLYLVGSGEDTLDEKILNEEARKLGIENAVYFTGFVPQREAWEYAKRACVCVSPLYPTPIFNYGFPTKLIEYMAMGKAVVGNEHPEQSVVISESKAGICVPYDEDSFAEAILYLLNRPEVCKKMGILGRDYVEKKRSYEQIANSVEQGLLQVDNMFSKNQRNIH